MKVIPALTETEFPIAQRVLVAHYGMELTPEEVRTEYQSLRERQQKRELELNEEVLMHVLHIKLGQAAFLS